MGKRLNAHKLVGTCECGRIVDTLFNSGDSYCCKCGRLYISWYNPKTEQYELIIQIRK